MLCMYFLFVCRLTEGVTWVHSLCLGKCPSEVDVPCRSSIAVCFSIVCAGQLTARKGFNWNKRCCIMHVWASLFILPVFSHTLMNTILTLSWTKIIWSYFSVSNIWLATRAYWISQWRNNICLQVIDPALPLRFMSTMWQSLDLT